LKSLDHDLDRLRIREDLSNDLEIFGIEVLKLFENKIIKCEKRRLLVTFIFFIHFLIDL